MEMTAISDEMIDYIEGLPKAELHVHLEGTIVAEMVLKLAARNGMDYPFKTLEEIHEALDKRTAGLVSFLDLHYLFVSFLKTRNDFYEVTYEFLHTCKANNVVYVAIKFDPQFHTEQGISFDDMINDIEQARKDGLRDFGVGANLIMCINRERTVESAWEMMEQAYPTWKSLYPGPRDIEGIKKMYDLGLKVTLNTDDPAEFNSWFMNQTLMGAVERTDYTKKDLVDLMRNAFDGSWLPREKKDAYIKQLHEYTG